ncbi:hypothetical protein B0T17DRAFT_599446 [Bombardia bombarda]|uniref:Hydantoinase n=1 Tax=Bombardia bombarda TaxID=252184 RepID=A0AA40C4U7_9PEZI|nr:hypothetical protein B0T17DRAFT_599446 [Bombardia bombarda]
MSTPSRPRHLRIGVDVGGTNTDGVLLDPSLAASPSKGIISWHKSPTTANPSTSINRAITALLASSSSPSFTAVPPTSIASVTIGTTAFVNAVVERDARRLSRVAVIRLCGPFSKHAPPCVDWPDDMRALVLGYFALVKGGLEVDGSLIGAIDEDEIRGKCAEIRALNQQTLENGDGKGSRAITSVVVNGVFSPIDTVRYKQEERAAEIIREEMDGSVDVVCSKEVANLGFLERENAAILNASILSYARRTIRGFEEGVRRMGLTCPVFVTQNDGTILSAEMAARLPIRTFSSGPTNSMRGAAFLVQDGGRKGEEGEGEAMMVVDIGGTTTDVGLLLANGFPRQQAAYSELAGVRMNFSCPDIKSIGLGGGSIVRKGDSDHAMTVGPDSVGYRLTKDSIIFGGKILTATDCTVLADPSLKIGNPELVKGALTDEELATFKTIIRQKLENAIDVMKTSPEDLPVILVGGGAIIAPTNLKGASKVLKPEWSAVANAIGAATAGVSAVVDTVRSTETKTAKQLLEEISKEAIQKAITAGATPESAKVVEMEELPLAYIANKTRFIVRAAGDFDFSRTDLAPDTTDPTSEQDIEQSEPDSSSSTTTTTPSPSPSPPPTPHSPPRHLNLLPYRLLPHLVHLRDRPPLDLHRLLYPRHRRRRLPYGAMILLRQLLRAGAVVRVVDPLDVPDDAAVGCGCGAGSPTVSIEKLQGDEMMQAQTELYKLLPESIRATHMIALEIGGGNGLQGMSLAASSNMDIPCVDGDWMGRAYPTKWQTTPVVFDERSPIWSPIAIADGNGNVVVMPKAVSDLAVERIMRVALSEMGSQVGCADPPVKGDEMKRWVVGNTISQAWRIGRAVARARGENRVDEVAEMIVEENENIAAVRIADSDLEGGEDGELERQEDVLAIVPDLISVIDAQNGEAVGTPEYRYGLLVVVLGIAASDKWTGTARGIELGGPKAFGFEHLEYQPLGTFVKPRSVVEEFNVEE